MKKSSFLTHLTNWEFWPTYMFYVPLFPFFLCRIIRARNPVYYLVTNPSILYSGIGVESKYETLQLIPTEYKPITIKVEPKDSVDEIIGRIEMENMNFPIIAKPDVGFRGYLVKKINSKGALKKYISNVKIPFLLQEFINYENEIGVFYHRFPGDKNGKITSITIKKYLRVTGNGRSTLGELIKEHDRAILYYNLFENIHASKIEDVIPKGDLVTLSVIGNHSKGSQFLNGNHLINNDLELVFDTLNDQINGWYYGRVDLKYKTWEDLIHNKSFKILEINGIISEPTHIYDASEGASFWDAVKSIKKHWKIMDKIALKNHREYQIDYPKLRPYVKSLLELKMHIKILKNAIS